MAEKTPQAGAKAPATSNPPSPPKEKTPSHMVVVMLRDERVARKDHKPGDTPNLPYATAQKLIAKGAADGDQGAVRAAQAKRKAQQSKKKG